MPGVSLARIQTAPVPPMRAKGLSPISCRGTFQREDDGIVGVGADGAELIGDAQDDARGVGTVGYQITIVWQQSEFPVDASARECSSR